MKRDPFKALEYFEKVKEADCYPRNIEYEIMEAQIGIGEFYYYDKDFIKALEWFEEAEKKEGVNEKRTQEDILKTLLEIARSYEKDLFKALEYYQKALKKDPEKRKKDDIIKRISGIQFKIGISYRKGQNGYPKDDAKAIEFLQKSAEQDYAPALYKLGRYYYKNENWEEAYQYFKKAAEAGTDLKLSAKAHYWVGILLESGTGCERDPQKTFQYWKELAEKGHKGALAQVGFHHGLQFLTSGSIANYYEAKEFLNKALEPDKDGYKDKIVSKNLYVIWMLLEKIDEKFIFSRRTQ